MFEILGYIFATIIAIVLVHELYYFIKGLVVGIDLMRWQLIGADWNKIRSTKFWPFKLIRMLLNCWWACVGDTPTYRRSNKTWSGWGTGR